MVNTNQGCSIHLKLSEDIFSFLCLYTSFVVIQNSILYKIQTSPKIKIQPLHCYIILIKQPLLCYKLARSFKIENYLKQKIKKIPNSVKKFKFSFILEF